MWVGRCIEPGVLQMKSPLANLPFGGRAAHWLTAVQFWCPQSHAASSWLLIARVGVNP
jgi:hypothetical protein